MLDQRLFHVLKIAARICFGAVTAVIIVFSLIPNPLPETNVLTFDKIVHVLAYGAVGFLAVSAFVRTTNRVKVFVLAAAFCFILGLSLECLQSFTGRTPDLLDQLCNTLGGLAGAGLGLLAARFWVRR